MRILLITLSVLCLNACVKQSVPIDSDGLPAIYHHTPTTEEEEYFNQLILRAEKSGSGHDQLQVAQIYNIGINKEHVFCDKIKAAKWYKKSAQQGNSIAQKHLAELILKGDGVLKDKIEAYAYYNLAAIDDTEAKEKRDLLEKELTPAQIDVGVKRSKELQKEIEAQIITL